MNYQTLSPSECAAEVLDEILKCVSPDLLIQEKVERLIRQKVRAILEQCAMIAEDYVVVNDPDEELSGIAVGDKIAEEIRQFADDRKTGRALAVRN